MTKAYTTLLALSPVSCPSEILYNFGNVPEMIFAHYLQMAFSKWSWTQWNTDRKRQQDNDLKVSKQQSYRARPGLQGRSWTIPSSYWTRWHNFQSKICLQRYVCMRKVWLYTYRHKHMKPFIIVLWNELTLFPVCKRKISPAAGSVERALVPVLLRHHTECLFHRLLICICSRRDDKLSSRGRRPRFARNYFM